MNSPTPSLKAATEGELYSKLLTLDHRQPFISEKCNGSCIELRLKNNGSLLIDFSSNPKLNLAETVIQIKRVLDLRFSCSLIDLSPQIAEALTSFLNSKQAKIVDRSIMPVQLSSSIISSSTISASERSLSPLPADTRGVIESYFSTPMTISVLNIAALPAATEPATTPVATVEDPAHIRSLEERLEYLASRTLQIERNPAIQNRRRKK